MVYKEMHAIVSKNKISLGSLLSILASYDGDIEKSLMTAEIIHNDNHN